MELNNSAIREVIADYVSDSNVVPDDIDIDDYLANTYNMDELVDAIYEACEDEDISPDALDPDVFVELLSTYDVADNCEVDIMYRERARAAGLGYSVGMSSDIKGSHQYYADTDSWMRAYLFVNGDKYGTVVGNGQGRLSALAEAFADELVTYDEMRGAGDRLHSYLMTDKGVLDMTPIGHRF
ncbi:MAG: hypothetical protein [Bacteriophage sp.]|nr:MAG: hypothetical protein [Bacteriophage sp.]